MKLHRVCLITSLLLLVGVGLVGIGYADSASSAVGDSASDVEIDSAVLEADGNETVIVRLEDRPESVVQTTSTDNQVDSMKAHAASSQASFEAFADGNPHVTIERQFWITNALVVTVDTDNIPIEQLGTVENVEKIHENKKIELLNSVAEPGSSDVTAGPELNTIFSPSEPTLTDHSEHTYGIEQINVPETWDDYNQGEGTRVAVLDTGVDIDNHSDLGDQLYTTDPDNSTYPGGWAEFDDHGDQKQSDPYDNNGHGTHVSGTVAGDVTDSDLHDGNSDLHYGVSPEVELMHAKVFRDDGNATSVAIIAGVEWALENDADVLSMSLGATGTEDAFIGPVRDAENAGVLVVAASGNDGGPTSSPANVYEAFSVGAVDSDEEIASFSSGETINKDEFDNPPSEWPDEFDVPDVAAPGVNTLSAVPGGQYEELDGTSMATPHVSGTAALMLSANDELTPQEIRDILRDTATEIDEDRNHDKLIDAHAAVAEAATSNFAVSIDEIDDAVIEDEEITVDYTVTNDGDEASTQDIEFRINETLEDSTETELEADESDSGQFTYETDGNDVPELTVEVSSNDDSVSDTVTVIGTDHPFFEVTIDEIDDEVTEGENITANYTVENIGDAEGTQDIALAVNGTVRNTTELTLSEGEAAEQNLTTETEAGDSPAITASISSVDDTAQTTVMINEPTVGVTIESLEFVDHIAGNNETPESIEFVVRIEENEAPLTRPLDLDNTTVTVGENVANSSNITDIASATPGQYRLIVPAPEQDALGTYDLQLAVEDSPTLRREDAIEYSTTTTTAKDEPVSLSVLLDVSGSMGDGEGSPRYTAKEAYSTLVNSLEPNDYVSFVIYGTDASTEQELTRVGGNVSEITEAIFAADNDAVGIQTNMGAGLDRGKAELDDGPANHTNATVVLTDGYPNKGPSGDEILSEDGVAEAHNESGYNIYSIAYRESANESFMRDLAAVTDQSDNVSQGPDQRFHTDPDANELRSIVLDIADSQSGSTTATSSTTGTVSADSSDTNGLSVDDGVSSATLDVTAAGDDSADSSTSALTAQSQDDAAVRLYDPSGELVETDPDSDTGTTRSDVVYLDSHSTDVYRLTDPETGNWSYEVVNYQSEPLSYDAQTTWQTDTSVSVHTNSQRYTTNSTVTLASVLTNSSGSVSATSATATVTTPDGETETVSLTEDNAGKSVGEYDVTAEGEYTATLTVETDQRQWTDTTAWTVANRTDVLDVQAATDSINTTTGQTVIKNITLTQTDDADISSLGTTDDATIYVRPSALTGSTAEIPVENVSVGPQSVNSASNSADTVTLELTIPNGTPTDTYTGELMFVVDDTVVSEPIAANVVDIGTLDHEVWNSVTSQNTPQNELTEADLADAVEKYQGNEQIDNVDPTFQDLVDLIQWAQE